jgi:uncharacterized cupredoxin-like copper-binding protein
VLRFRIALALALTAALVVSAVAFGSSSTSRVVKPTRITVTLRDYSFTFSKRLVRKGTAKSVTVVFTVKNAGSVQHNLDFASLNKRTPILAPGGKSVLKVVFKKKGTYQVVCDVPRHIQLGMVSTFKIA